MSHSQRAVAHAAHATRAQHARAADAKEQEPEVAKSAPRKVGDYAVQRFSGSYQATPFTLTEEVVAQEGELWVIDYTLENAESRQQLRVRLDPKTESVVRVSQLDASGEKPGTLAQYEQMMERTSLAADENEGLVNSEQGTCLVGVSELDCETKSYKVRIGEREATLSVSHASQVAGRDVAGEITASDGTLLYRAELLELGSADSASGDVASR